MTQILRFMACFSTLTMLLAAPSIDDEITEAIDKTITWLKDKDIADRDDLINSLKSRDVDVRSGSNVIEFDGWSYNRDWKILRSPMKYGQQYVLKFQETRGELSISKVAISSVAY